ncbi:MAG: DNA polymerase III subunit delta [Flavobacteriales bacterium]|nr:DNA polymerase III subunit delta [Flavobacteriales bacterium]|tara:strand:- start:210 stop:1208 length:999 start_codon:yes stop_codon:yes gene_type:complete
MKYHEIINEIQKKNFNNVYFLYGDEPYYIDLISDTISNTILHEDEKPFNQTTLYGKETNIETIISEAKEFPFGAKYRVIILKEAQYIKSIEKLENYLQSQQLSTILVICYKNKKIDKRKSFYKILKKNAILFESKKIYDNQIPEWIRTYLNNHNIKIEIKSCHLIAESLGNNLSKIDNEIKKLLIDIEDNNIVTPELIEKHIGISKDYNIFELQSAIGKKDILKTNLIVKHFAKNQKHYPFVLTISNLFSFFQKTLIFHKIKNTNKNNIANELRINPYFIRDFEISSKNYSIEKLFSIFEILRDYDLKSKGINNPSIKESELLREMILKILK